MVRTLVAIDEADKEWLDRRAAEEGVPMAELIRRAVRLLREQDQLSAKPFEDLLNATRGLWRRGDGLEYQEALRREW